MHEDRPISKCMHTHPDSCSSCNLAGTLALHHSHWPPVVNPDLINVPSRSNAATLHELLGFILTACKHDLVEPSGSSQWNGPLGIGACADLEKNGWTEERFNAGHGIKNVKVTFCNLLWDTVSFRMLGCSRTFLQLGSRGTCMHRMDMSSS